MQKHRKQHSRRLPPWYARVLGINRSIFCLIEFLESSLSLLQSVYLEPDRACGTDFYNEATLFIPAQYLNIKLQGLGILNHPDYKICFGSLVYIASELLIPLVLDHRSMFRTTSVDKSGKPYQHAVKPLGLDSLLLFLGLMSQSCFGQSFRNSTQPVRPFTL